MSESALLLFIILLHHLEETLPPLDIPQGGGLDQSLTLKFNKDNKVIYTDAIEVNLTNEKETPLFVWKDIKSVVTLIKYDYVEGNWIYSIKAEPER